MMALLRADLGSSLGIFGRGCGLGLPVVGLSGMGGRGKGVGIGLPGTGLDDGGPKGGVLGLSRRGSYSLVIAIMKFS